jgi:hypothetical protein
VQIQILIPPLPPWVNWRLWVTVSALAADPKTRGRRSAPVPQRAASGSARGGRQGGDATALRERATPPCTEKSDAGRAPRTHAVAE